MCAVTRVLFISMYVGIKAGSIPEMAFYCSHLKKKRSSNVYICSWNVSPEYCHWVLQPSNTFEDKNIVKKARNGLNCITTVIILYSCVYYLYFSCLLSI